MPAAVMADLQTTLAAPIADNSQVPPVQTVEANKEQAPAPASTAVAPQPQKTTLALAPPVIPVPKKDDPASESRSKDPTALEASSTQPAQKGSGKVADPGVSNDPKQAEDAGPSATPELNQVQSPDTSNGNPQTTVDPNANKDAFFPKGAIPALPVATKPIQNSNGNSQKAADPGQGSKQPDNPLPSFDPSNVDSDQMSQLDKALAPGYQASATPVKNVPQQQTSSPGALPSSDTSHQSDNDPSKSSGQNPSDQQNNPESTVKSPSQDSPQQQGNPASGSHSPNQGQKPDNNTPGASVQVTPQQPNSTPGSTPTDSGTSNSGSPGTLGGNSPQQLNSPGGSPVTPATTISIASHAVVVGPSGVHVDGSKVQYQEGPVSVPGGAAINNGNSIVLGSQIYNIPSATPPPTTIMAGHVVSPVTNGAIINGDTITQGAAAATVSGTPVSVDSGSKIYIDDTAYQLPSVKPAPTTILPNGAAAAVVSNGISVHGTTITAGASAVTISGTVVSLDSSQNLIYGGTAVALPTAPASVPNPGLTAGQVATINDLPVVQLTNGVSIAGTTLTPGASAIIISGTPIAFGSSALVIGSSSFAFAVPSPGSDSLVTTIAGQVINANPSALVLASTTLTPGASGVTISGTPVALDTAGDLVVGSNTVTLGSGSSSTGLGGLILSGLGAGGSASTISPSIAQGNSSIPIGTQSTTSTTASTFAGGSNCLSGVPEWKTVMIVVMVITMMLCIA